jgi:predicted metal-dependent peptidase
MDNAIQRLRAARRALVLDQPFFGCLALRLTFVESSRTETMATDGTHLFYNRAYVKAQSDEVLQTLLMHEVMHCAQQHHTRRGEREPGLWNTAADHAINPLLVAAGGTLWEGALCDPRFKGKSSENIFSTLQDEQQRQKQQEKQEQQDQEGDGAGGAGGQEESDSDGDDDQDGAGGEQGDDDDGQGQPGTSQKPSGDKGDQQPKKPQQPGEVFDAPDKAQDEAEWTVAVKQAAAAAQMMGKMPGSLKMLVEEMTRARTDWRSLLRRFIQQTCASDYSWKMPNRRYIGQGLYLPAVRSEQMGPMVVFVDSSYSTGPFVPMFKGELQAIVDEVQPEKVIVVMADAAVQRVDVFERGEPVEFHLTGLGGTDFRPAFEWAQAEGVEPACAVYLTDGDGLYPDAPPDYPVMWAITTSIEAPWGDTVKLEAE